MSQLVGVDVGQPGGRTGLVDESGDGVPVQRSAVLARQQQRMLGRDVGAAEVVDEVDDLGVGLRLTSR